MAHIHNLLRGEWSAGWRVWPGKPMLWVGWEYYDGMHYVLHVGPFWLACDY